MSPEAWQGSGTSWDGAPQSESAGAGLRLAVRDRGVL